MSPQLGQGVNMALLDAHALRDALRVSGDVPEALARYAARARGDLPPLEPLAHAAVPVRPRRLGASA